MEERTFYKYLTIEHTFELLEKRILHYSFPHEFNDPFDCYVRTFYRDASLQEWKDHFKKRCYPKELQDLYLKKVEEYNYDFNLMFKEIPELIITNYSDILLICCFTAVNGSLPMWAHYAKNHTGICVGFRTFKIPAIPNTILTMDEDNYNILIMDENNFSSNSYPENHYFPLTKVTYSNNLPEPYDLIKDERLEMIRFLMTKNIEGEYENEYRCSALYNNYKRQNLQFKKESLAEVIIGINTRPEDINKIKSILTNVYKSSGLNVKLLQAVHAQNKYKINFIDVPY